ncbi:MAG: transposase zinc-binding domain-containing protein [Myxococcota bacterium]
MREWWPAYVEAMGAKDSSVPAFVRNAVSRLLGCGDPEKGFIRFRCPDCAAERALPFSCKGRGLCPSCGARRIPHLQTSLRSSWGYVPSDGTQASLPSTSEGEEPSRKATGPISLWLSAGRIDVLIGTGPPQASVQLRLAI